MTAVGRLTTRQTVTIIMKSYVSNFRPIFSLYVGVISGQAVTHLWQTPDGAVGCDSRRLGIYK